MCCPKELTGQESFHDWSSCDNYWSTNEETFHQIVANLRTLTWWESVTALLIYVSSAIWANVRTFATISGFIFLRCDYSQDEIVDWQFGFGFSTQSRRHHDWTCCPGVSLWYLLTLNVSEMKRQIDTGRIEALTVHHFRCFKCHFCHIWGISNCDLVNMRLHLTQLRRQIWRELYFAEKYDPDEKTSLTLVGLTLVTGCQISRFFSQKICLYSEMCH